MKRNQRSLKVQVFIGEAEHQCDMCHHSRKDEPFAQIEYYRTNGKNRVEIRCWRCCRDAESTFLIQQKWPLAFVRGPGPGYWILEWSDGVKVFLGDRDEAQTSS